MLCLTIPRRTAFGTTQLRAIRIQAFIRTLWVTPVCQLRAPEKTSAGELRAKSTSLRVGALFRTHLRVNCISQ